MALLALATGWIAWGISLEMADVDVVNAACYWRRHGEYWRRGGCGRSGAAEMGVLG